MNQRIIYKTDNDVLAIVIPSQESVALYGIETIAAKDVPFGKPYKIVDASEIPTDRVFREAWTIDEADLTDGVGANFGAGSDWVVTAYSKDWKPTALFNTKTNKSETLKWER